MSGLVGGVNREPPQGAWESRLGTSSDYIPYKDADFDVWFRNLCEVVTAKTSGQNPAWTHIPMPELGLLTGAYADGHAAYGPVSKPCGL